MSWPRRNWAVLAAVSAGLFVGALTAALLLGGDDERTFSDPLARGSLAPSPARASQQGDRTTGVAPPTVEIDDGLSVEEARSAARAALAVAGGGRVVEVDRSDDPGESYEVEVHKPNGGEIDVALDERFRRVPNEPYDD